MGVVSVINYLAINIVSTYLTGSSKQSNVVANSSGGVAVQILGTNMAKWSVRSPRVYKHL